MPTPFSPLAALQAWYDDNGTAASIRLYLLNDTVDPEDVLDSFDNVADLPGHVASTGGYDDSTGIDAGAWPIYFDTSHAVMELSLPTATWTSADPYSLSFRWVVVALGDGTILNAVDFTTVQTLDNVSLQLYAAESVYIPNSWPVFRWRKA